MPAMVAIGAAAMLLSMSFPSFAHAAQGELLSETEIKSTAGEYLESMANLLISGSHSEQDEAVMRAKKSIQPSSMTEAEIEEICAWRDDLAPDVRYSDAEVSWDVVSQRQKTDGSVVLRVDETTYLTLSDEGFEEGYFTEHEFVCEKGPGGWELTADNQLSPTGLLPEYRAEKYVVNKGLVAGELQDTVVEAAIADQIEELEKDAVPEIEASIEPLSEAGDPGISTYGAVASTYNSTAAAKYLATYWSKPNPKYRTFEKDCTNFASQALRAGGWTFVTGYKNNSNYWWYNNTTQSKSWVNVEYLGSFARSSKRCVMLKSVWKLGLGDMLQVKPAGSSVKSHTMMVSYIDKNGKPCLTYHTTNRHKVPMSEIIKKYPGGTFYAYDIR